MRTFKKQPSEVFDYDIELDDWFSLNDDGDEIKEVTVSSSPAFGAAAPDLVSGPTVTDSQAQDTVLPVYQLLPGGRGLLRRAKLWIGYGTDGVDYTVTAAVLTNLGRKDEMEFKIRVREEP